MKVKICGVCRASDAEAVSATGADYIGVILAAGSPRTLSLEQAREVLAAAHGPERVGVFVDAPIETVAHAISFLHLDVVQLHGGESPQDVTALKRFASVWKAVRVRTPAEIPVIAENYAAADGILLDAWHPSQAGGTGTALDWGTLALQRERLAGGPLLVLAGGLTPNNVGSAIQLLRPDAVDVSSGVEDAPGIKSVEKIQAFIAAARTAIASRTEA